MKNVTGLKALVFSFVVFAASGLAQEAHATCQQYCWPVQEQVCQQYPYDVCTTQQVGQNCYSYQAGQNCYQVQQGQNCYQVQTGESCSYEPIYGYTYQTYCTTQRTGIFGKPKQVCYQYPVQTIIGYDQNCQPIYQEQCDPIYNQVCDPIYQTQCDPIYDNVCHTEYQEQCWTNETWQCQEYCWDDNPWYL